jgi:adenylate cyclase
MTITADITADRRRRSTPSTRSPARHGVERVKLLGDSCFVVVGHQGPLLDHARRAAEFAREVIGAVDDLHGRHDPDGRHDRHDRHDPDGGIALAAGLASGPVSTGLGGSDRLVYDVWGRTATIAYEHARRAGPGTVEIDASTAERLPAASRTAASRTAASRTADRGSADPGEATR